MKEFAPDRVGVSELLAVDYPAAFNMLVDEKLSEPQLIRQRSPKARLYREMGFFRQFFNSDLIFIFQKDLESGGLYFAVQQAIGGYSHEFGEERGELVKRTYNYVDHSDIRVETVSERPLSPEEMRVLMEVMRDPMNFTQENLPGFVNFTPGEVLA